MDRDKRVNQVTGVIDERPAGQAAAGGNTAANKFPVGMALIAILAIGGGAAYFMSKPKEAAKSKDDAVPIVMTVGIAPAHNKVIDRHLSVNGSISAWDPLAVGAEIAQLRVEAINVDEGSVVKKGQVLATLNSRVLKAQLAQQQAHLAADEATVRKAIQPNRVEDLNTWRAGLQQAEANLAQEEANLIRAKANAANSQENARRYTELGKVGAVSKMDAETKVTDSKTSAADVNAAEKRADAMRFSLRQAHEKLAMAERGGRQEDIVISNSTLGETKARIAELEAQIEQTIISAPADGKIVKRDVHLGEISSVGKTMFTMVRNGRLELKALVPEVEIPRIKPGMPVKLNASGEDANSLTGKVREVSPSVDEKTRLGTARIDLPNNPQLKPGLFYHADIDLGKTMALVVPSKAVMSRNDKEVVFLFQGNKGVMRYVKVGEPLSNGQIEIISGLKAGDEVIISGAGFMKDGDVVRAVPEESTSK